MLHRAGKGDANRGRVVKIKTYPNGYTTFERLFPSGMYLVQVYRGAELHDKVRCDDYGMARQYLKAFNAIAKGAA